MKYFTLISNILACYAFLQIVVSKYIIARHNKRMKDFPGKISGGSLDTWEASQKAVAYNNTKWAKFVRMLKKVF